MLALAHIAAELKRLLEGEPERAGITFHRGCRPQHHDIDPLVGNAVVPQRAGDFAGSMISGPWPHPGPHTLLEIRNNPVGDLGIDIPKFVHLQSPF